MNNITAFWVEGSPGKYFNDLIYPYLTTLKYTYYSVIKPSLKNTCIIKYTSLLCT